MTCTICQRTRVGWVSPVTGEPWCDHCEKRWATCSACSTVAPTRGGTYQEPLCARCVNPDPNAWKRCSTCAAPWQLTTRPCLRCTLDQQVRELLGGPDQRIPEQLTPLHAAILSNGRPDTTVTWLKQPKVTALLRTLSAEPRLLTHETLDELPASKAVSHLRSILVATSTLPTRDEYLTRLERWIAQTLKDHTDPVEHRILHGYAVWHHLRRLRNRLNNNPATRLQATTVRTHVTAAVNFLDWLRDQHLTLATCTQADLDRWMTSPNSTYPGETSHFIRWSVSHRHATGLTYPAIQWAGPAASIDTERRWSDVRRLLHDTNLTTPDRVAGLLLLLYAQRPRNISRLTTSHVSFENDRTQILFGSKPVTLPEPLADLVQQLVATRKERSKPHTPDSSPWLFPGSRPGEHIDFASLDERLKRIGLRPRPDRSTAMFDLAANVPAGILARTLGINVEVAVTWQQIAAGDWAAYAAELARRTSNAGAAR
ncbi:hypothetical protein ACISU4_01140 [Streptomyces wuyuanensis]|uniref:hypothetical protein n=1 Tax=Streptomyces wuyuanensis TaxID=1196353 RepID=UPI00381FA4D2